jgi:hypothetical protein
VNTNPTRTYYQWWRQLSPPTQGTSLQARGLGEKCSSHKDCCLVQGALPGNDLIQLYARNRGPCTEVYIIVSGIVCIFFSIYSHPLTTFVAHPSHSYSSQNPISLYPGVRPNDVYLRQPSSSAPSAGFFQGASYTNASRSTFTHVGGDQYNLLNNLRGVTVHNHAADPEIDVSLPYIVLPGQLLNHE